MDYDFQYRSLDGVVQLILQSERSIIVNNTVVMKVCCWCYTFVWSITVIQQLTLQRDME